MRRQVSRSLIVVLVTLSVMGAFGSLSTRADSTGTVTVSANVTAAASLTLTIYDAQADFGTGLNASGASVTGTVDTIGTSGEGTTAGQGVFYVWFPAPGLPASPLLNVSANVPFSLTACATANSGTNPSLQLSQGDLRFGNPATYEYNTVQTASTAFPLCATPATAGSFTPGSSDFFAKYFLRVDDLDQSGTFASTTTWSMIAA